MDANYWRLRCDVLGEEMTQHLRGVIDLESYSEEKRFRWGMSLKEMGNTCFRKGDILGASLIYETIADGVVPILCTMTDGMKFYFQLVIPCLLNQAACFLKLEEFDKCIGLCSDILLLDDTNVKGLYRRGQAYAKKGDLQAALLDYTKAQAIESRNTEIGSEIASLQRLVKQQGHDDEQGNNCIIMSECKEDDEVRDSDVRASEMKKRRLDENDSQMGKKMMRSLSFDPLGCYQTKGSEDSKMVDEESVPTKVAEATDEKGDLLNGAASRDTSTASNGLLAEKTHMFSNTKHRSLKLRMRTSDIELLTKGKVLTFYNPVSFSSMTVRVSIENLISRRKHPMTTSRGEQWFPLTPWSWTIFMASLAKKNQTLLR